MNLYEAVLELERVKNRPELTDEEIAEKARQIFKFDREKVVAQAKEAAEKFFQNRG